MAKNTTLEAALGEVLDEFAKDEREALFKGVREAAKVAKRDVTQLSPRGYSGDYAQGWAIKTKKGRDTIEATVYNRTKPSLTYLLEKGHVIVNKYGPQNKRDGGGNRTKAIPHISTARERAAEYIMKELQKTL